MKNVNALWVFTSAHEEQEMSREMYCQTFRVQNRMHYFKLGFLLSESLILNLSPSRTGDSAFHSVLPELWWQPEVGTGFHSHLEFPSGLDHRGLEHSEGCPKRITMVMRCSFTQLDVGIGLQGECSPKEEEEKQSLPKEEPCLPSSSSCLISRGRTDSWLINRYGGSVGKMLKYFHVGC